MSCTTYLEQCACENSIIELIVPADGTYTLEIYNKFNNKKRSFDVIVEQGDNFILPMELNPFSVYELTIKQGATVIEIDDVNKWYLRTMVCVDAEVGTVVNAINSFSYLFENESGEELDISGTIIELATGDITINEALFTTYNYFLYKDGTLLNSPNGYTFNVETQVITFEDELAGNDINIVFIKK